MRQDLVPLATRVHTLYNSLCECKLPCGPEHARHFVKCARTTLLKQADILTHELAKLGYSNKQIAKDAHFDPSITSRAHGGGADLQLGLGKLFDLVQSLDGTLSAARKERFDFSIGERLMRVVQPFDFCSAVPIGDDILRDKAADAVYSNIRSILLSRPLTDRRQLPEGVEGLVAFLGDPGFGVIIIQLEPTTDSERLRTLLHELKHVEERLEHKLQELQGEKRKNRKSGRTRARFS